LIPDLTRLIADVDPIVLLLFLRRELARLTDSPLQFGKKPKLLQYLYIYSFFETYATI
jgi:hypothetical protein